MSFKQLHSKESYLKVVVYLFLISMLISCAEDNQRAESVQSEVEYELIEKDYLIFRRAYWGQDTLEGKELEVFMNRDPEPCEDYTDSKKHPLYAKLIEANIVLDGNLNINRIDTLPDAFNYQIDGGRIINVEKRLLDDPKQVKELSYELTFREGEKILLVDSLECGFPPDVTFFIKDLENDGSHELLTIFQWYIVNGDNYDVRIYNLNEKPRRSVN